MSEFQNKQKTIVLVSCVKSKQDCQCQAADMYVSPLFKKMMAYANRLNAHEIFILSAKYGLLKLNDPIAPYEQTLKNMGTKERHAWAVSVLAKLSENYDLNKDQFIFLAGPPYRENLVSRLKHYSVPMEGLSFGKQLQWLEEQTK